ncbi:hypothetical protein PV733_36970 [Streptomyces europaeiscabiei]|uniref:hypothetical protein n=1 Tax=Streptomyces europaeiscabiei TaxID=146819 RepID=UPI0029AEE078|nr:hypothetical protein [Streptomyces europaeiscabiei]MDX3714425.1 hypothetical protein [Streptomyces europaeiscabiei]
MTSVFAAYADTAWPHRYNATITVKNLAGGVPTDPRVAEGWLRTKLAKKDDLIRELVAQTMVERGITADEATDEVDKLKHLNGFKRNEHGLYIEGRQLKAAIKEAAGVARATDKLKMKWGTTNKGLLGFVAEHIMVVEDTLPLHHPDSNVPVTEASRVLQSFPKNPRTGQTGIQYTEILEEASFDFTVISDHKFSDQEWQMLWLTGEQQGIGASRSQGFGRYEVTRWEQAD